MRYSTSKKNQTIVNKYLPHNFLAEKMILGCLLINPEAIEISLKTISSDFFYFKNHQEIYKTIVFFYQNRIPIDILTLITFLQDNGLLKKIGGVKVLIELLRQVPNLVYFEEYLRLLKDKYIRRSLIQLSYEIINSSYLTSIPLENILNDLETKLFSFTDELCSQKLESSAEIINTIFFQLKTKSINSKFYGMSSGFDDLDSLTQGFQKSDLIIIAGRPSMGKTALSLNIALNLVKTSKLPILFFSLEMSKEQLIYRLLAMETNINQMKLKSGKLDRIEWVKLTKIIKILAKFPLFIDDTPDLSVQDIRSKVKTILFEQHKLGLVIIDYLQLIKSLNFKSDNRVQELSYITRSLKILAREFNIPVIGLSQLSRNVEQRINKKPILSDLRESGSIEQDADLVLLMYRNSSNIQTQSECKLSQLTELIIAKQRNGPTGTVTLKFNQEHTKFYNMNKKV